MMPALSDWGVKLFDVLEEKEAKSDSVPFEMEDGRPLRVHWSPDGQILSVSTRNGEKGVRQIPPLSLPREGRHQCLLWFWWW